MCQRAMAKEEAGKLIRVLGEGKVNGMAVRLISLLHTLGVMGNAV